MPDAPGKLAYEKHGDTTYVKYEYDRIYDLEKKFTYPKRTTIGKCSKEKRDIFRPNQNYLTCFPTAELPISDYRNTRSRWLRIGTFIMMRKIIKDYKLEEILGMYFNDRDYEEKSVTSVTISLKICLILWTYFNKS